MTAASAAVLLAVWWRTGSLDPLGRGWLPWLFVPVVIIMLGAGALYRRGLRRNFLDEVGPLETAVALATLAVLTILLVDPDRDRPGALAVRLWICAAVLIPAVRLLHAVIHQNLRKRHRAAAPTLIVGNSRIAHQLITRMEQMPEYGLRPVGVLNVVPPAPIAPDQLFAAVPYLGPPEGFAAAAEASGAEEVIISPSDIDDEHLVAMAREAHQRGMRVWVVPRLDDAIGAQVEHFGGLPLLLLPPMDAWGWQFAVKHGSDRVLAAVGLLALSPALLILTLLVKLSSPGPILFRQRRVGRDGKPFDCLKFRSMRSPEASGGIDGADRRTRIGTFLRATSLDKLPQLVNVVRGDMSVVGPRPERPDFVGLFDLQIRRYGERHRVKAGMTGWAQVHGLRGQTSIADRAEWDNFYIDNWSLWLDLKILLLTIPAALRRSQI